MRRLALAIMLCAVSLAVPAAAAPIDPGRFAVQTATAVHTQATPAVATDYTFVPRVLPAAVGDRPADGRQRTALVAEIGGGASFNFNLATIDTQRLFEPAAAAISP